MTVPSHQSMYSGDPSRGGMMVLFLSYKSQLQQYNANNL